MSLFEPLVGARWRDWLDILLLAFVLYRLFLVIQGTRAVQSLLGLGLLGALYLASGIAGLSAVHWVLDKLFVYIVIAVLILFQEDIRRVLARAGGTLFSRAWRLSAPSQANVMEEIVKAVFALAHRKIGALMVIERQASLERYVEGAQSIDAIVSSSMLLAVFHPSSPLHDGAIVISHGRVVAAGVFLPISLSKEVARTWGTRHRAAIGLSEETDALCLVVSEERGTVALVNRGEITPVADPNDLRRMLIEKLGEHATRTKGKDEVVGSAGASA